MGVPVRLSSAAFTAALEDLHGLRYSTQKASLYESLLTAKWMESHGRYPNPAIADCNDAVEALFHVDPTAAVGRLYPFRYDWRVSEGSGRKTVWNNTTRGSKLATTIFQGDDIRKGLLPNSPQIVRDALDGDPLPSRQALGVLLLRNNELQEGDSWGQLDARLLELLNMTTDELAAVTADRPLGSPLLAPTTWSPEAIPETLAPTRSVTVELKNDNDNSGPITSIELDTRVERMLRRSIERYQCILLVGPPGTGKGTLVRWLTDLAKANPTSFGFDPALDPMPMWRTPDESWSAFDLIGGLAPDADGSLRWSNGLLLNAISEQRWLVLDETNRADLDKIMGPLLTWLSAQEVEVGRTKPHGGSPIHLGWADGPASTTPTSDDGSEPQRYLAGKDWRLIGTYNPQDAQRVFRMGMALSRRFVVIPVPALRPGRFEVLLNGTHQHLHEDARTSIVALYSAHHSHSSTLLGPAVFLRMAAYLNGPMEPDVAQHVAEAYVANIGKFVSAFDDATFNELGDRVIHDEQAMTEEQWNWVSAQRSIIG